MKRILIFSFLFIILISGVSAFDWYLDKATTCSLLNKTGNECETFWCNSIQGGKYNETREICEFVIIINETKIIEINITANQTQNQTFVLNSTEYYNKTEIENFTNNLIRELRDSIADNYALKSEIKLSNTKISSDSFLGDSNMTIILIIFAIGCGLFLYFREKSKIPKNPLHEGKAKIEYPKLQYKKEKQLESELEEAQKKLEEKQDEKIKKKPKKEEDEE